MYNTERQSSSQARLFVAGIEVISSAIIAH